VSRLLRCATRWQHSFAQPTLNPVTPDDITHFAQFLPPNAILSTLSPIPVPPSEIEQYNTDWMGKYRGSSTTVLRPQTTEQVSKIMKWCHERRIGVVPQGGNTGLVGGSVPLKDELILSLSNMAKVRSFDPVSGVSETSCSSVLAQVYSIHSMFQERLWPMLDAF
jgi:(R)-2-hydroxyglutarate---pyruvate transhydrogenase